MHLVLRCPASPGARPCQGRSSSAGPDGPGLRGLHLDCACAPACDGSYGEPGTTKISLVHVSTVPGEARWSTRARWVVRKCWVMTRTTAGGRGWWRRRRRSGFCVLRFPGLDGGGGGDVGGLKNQLTGIGLAWAALAVALVVRF